MYDSIRNYCKNFRIFTLHLTLTQLAEISNDSIANLSAFERGKSNSLKYPFYYYGAANKEQKEQFVRGFFECPLN